MSDIAQLGFSVNTRGLVTGERALDGFARKGENTERRIGNSTKSMNNDFMSLNKVIGMVGIALAAIGVASLARDIANYSDQWKNVNSQLRQVTDNEADLLKVRAQLLTVTKETRGELTNTVNLYAEMLRGTTDLNISSERLIGVTRTLNNLFVAGGKPISESAGAIRQLNQGFAAGALRGDEFNSVAEGAPKVLDALTAKLNITRGELREFAATGGITAEILISALEGYEDSAQKLADQTEKTFGQNLQNANTNVVQFVGNSKLMSDAVGGVGSTLESASKNLGALSDAFLAVVGTVAVALIPSLYTYIAVQASALKAQLLLGTSAAVVGMKMGVATTGIVTATFATNALGIATRFLLGPFGLLIAALGIGVTAFIGSKNAASELTEEIKSMNSGVDDSINLYDRYINKISKAQSKSLEGMSQGAIQDEFDLSTKKISAYEERLNGLIESSASLARISNLETKLKLERIQLEALGEALPIAKTSMELLTGATEKLILSLDPAANAAKQFSEGQELINKALKSGVISKAEAAYYMDLLSSKYSLGQTESEETAQSFLEQNQAIAEQIIQLRLGADAFEIYAAKMEAMQNGVTDPAQLSALEERIKLLQETRKIVQQVEKDEADAAKANESNLDSITAKLDGFGGAWTRTGSIIVDAFGSISDAIDDYTKKTNALADIQESINADRKKDGADQVALDKQEARLKADLALNEISGMRSVAEVGQSLFAEKTAAAKAFGALNQILAVTEIALSFQKMAASTTETGVVVANEATKANANAFTAITAAFAAPFPVGFVAGAAMVGIMASLLGGSFGGGGVSDPTQELQDLQGTGTLLGSDEKSNSILNSQDEFNDLQIDQLFELRGIRASMSALSNGITNLAQSFSASTGDLDFKGETGKSTFLDSDIGGLLRKLDPVARIMDLLGLGGIADRIFSAFSSTTRSIIDNGISFISQTLGEIIDSGIVEAQAFFTVKTKKKRFFGLSRSESSGDEFQDIGGEIQQQMGNIFGFIGDSVLESARLLGIETVGLLQSNFIGPLNQFDFSEFGRGLYGAFAHTFDIVQVDLEEALSGFEIDIGKVSFEGLSGEEIEAELQAIFSQQSDLIAEFLVPSVKQFQQVGEGLFETLTRVAREQVIFNDQIKTMGFDLSGVSKIIQIEFAQSIIGLVGGIEQFTELTSEYIDNFFSEQEKFEILEGSLNDVFESLGIGLVNSKEGFRSLIEGLDITTEEGQATLAALLELSPAMAEYIEALQDERIAREDSARSAFGILEQSIKLEKQRAQAVLDGATDAYNAEILRINGLRDALDDEQALRQDAYDKSESTLITSFAAQNQAIELEKQRAQVVLNSAKTMLDAELSRIEGLRSALDIERSLREQNIIDSESALNKAFDAEISMIQSNSSARIDALNSERSALDGTASSMQSLIDSLDSASGASGVSLVQALSMARGGDFSGAQSLDASGLGNQDSSGFASASELAISNALNRNRLASIADLASEELTETQNLINTIDRQILATQADSYAQINALTEQLNSLLGIDDNTLSISEAIDKLSADQSSLEELNYDNQVQSFDALIKAANNDYALAEKDYNDSIQNFDALIAANNEQLNSLLGIVDNTLSIKDATLQFNAAKLSLDSLNYDAQSAQFDMLINSADEVYQLHQSAYENELTRLDGILDYNEQLLNVALGIDNSILSVGDAVNALNSAIAAIPAQQQQVEQSNSSTENQELKQEIANMREDNVRYNREVVKNTKSTASILQRLEFNGIDTRSAIQ